MSGRLASTFDLGPAAAATGRSGQQLDGRQAVLSSPPLSFVENFFARQIRSSSRGLKQKRGRHQRRGREDRNRKLQKRGAAEGERNMKEASL